MSASLLAEDVGPQHPAARVARVSLPASCRLGGGFIDSAQVEQRLSPAVHGEGARALL